MTKNKKIAFFILMAVWFLGIASYTAYKEYWLNFGTSVMLKVNPVDPRDLFRGDYVILDYVISRQQRDQKFIDYNGEVHESMKVNSGNTVYVMLVKDGSFYKGGNIYAKKPKKGLFIKGSVGKRFNFSSNFTIVYGIENYYVPEGEGLKLEKERNRNRLSAKIMLDLDGNASIKNLYIDNKKVDFKNKDEEIN